jgi:hypothetical protein
MPRRGVPANELTQAVDFHDNSTKFAPLFTGKGSGVIPTDPPREENASSSGQPAGGSLVHIIGAFQSHLIKPNQVIFLSLRLCVLTSRLNKKRRKGAKHKTSFRGPVDMSESDPIKPNQTRKFGVARVSAARDAVEAKYLLRI